MTTAKKKTTKTTKKQPNKSTAKQSHPSPQTLVKRSDEELAVACFNYLTIALLNGENEAVSLERVENIVHMMTHLIPECPSCGGEGHDHSHEDDDDSDMSDVDPKSVN